MQASSRWWCQLLQEKQQRLRVKAAGGRLTDGKADLQSGRAGHRAAPEEAEEQKEERRQLVSSQQHSLAASLVSLIRGVILLAHLFF